MSKPQSDLNQKEANIPDWLKMIQLNSWEAELLISALLLYMLFQVPGFLENYRDQHYSGGSVIGFILKIFITALKVLRIGYSIHIVARGIWVASVGLSYVFPESIRPDRLRFKGKFGDEVKDDVTLSKTIKNLEKVASLSYALSFMVSGMVISAGLLLIYLITYQNFVMRPLMENGSVLLISLAYVGVLIYIIMTAIVFIDFMTNGLLRREPSLAKGYYYLAIPFRYLTLSFLYNRIQFAIISNLPKWQAHLVPIAAAALIGGYLFIENKIDSMNLERYHEQKFDGMIRMNYESMRKKDDPIYAIIQDDVIAGNVIELFIRSHGIIGSLYQKEESMSAPWSDLENQERIKWANKYVHVSIDRKSKIDTQWIGFKHPVSYELGFKGYIDISKLPIGLHKLEVALDTAIMNDLQLRVVRERDPSFVTLGSIPFYKSE